MKYKKAIFALIFVFILALALFFITLPPSLSPSDPAEVLNVSYKCNTLYYNSASATNIVFFSTKEEAKEYSDSLFSLPPFNEHKNSFNFYYIENYTPECDIYKGIAILCYSKELIKRSSICPNDYIAVISDNPSNIRSSSYINVLSINKNSPITVFAHEFGHAFATLDEEYVPAKLSSSSKNCFSDCSNFNPGECFLGCSDSEFYRSIDKGIMRSLYSDSFGGFDENILKNTFSKSFTSLSGNAISDFDTCNDKKYYLIKGYIENGNILVVSKSLETGCAGGNGNGDYVYELISYDDKVTIEGNFNPGVLYTDSQTENMPTIEGEIFDYNEFILKINAENSPKEVLIKDKNSNTLSSISIKQTDKVCFIK